MFTFTEEELSISPGIDARLIPTHIIPLLKTRNSAAASGTSSGATSASSTSTGSPIRANEIETAGGRPIDNNVKSEVIATSIVDTSSEG